MDVVQATGLGATMPSSTSANWANFPDHINRGISTLPGVSTRNARRKSIEARTTARAAARRRSQPIGMRRKPRLCTVCYAAGANAELPCSGAFCLKHSQYTPAATNKVRELRVSMISDMDGWLKQLNKMVGPVEGDDGDRPGKLLQPQSKLIGLLQ